MGAKPPRGTGLRPVRSRASYSCSAWLVALALTGYAAAAADQDPVQIKLNDVDTRLTRIEGIVSNQSLLGLANQEEALRNDLRAMHNDVDLLSNSLAMTGLGRIEPVVPDPAARSGAAAQDQRGTDDCEGDQHTTLHSTLHLELHHA